MDQHGADKARLRESPFFRALWLPRLIVGIVLAVVGYGIAIAAFLLHEGGLSIFIGACVGTSGLFGVFGWLYERRWFRQHKTAGD